MRTLVLVFLDCQLISSTWRFCQNPSNSLFLNHSLDHTTQIPILLDHFNLRDYYHVLTCHIFASSHYLFLLILLFVTWVKIGLLLAMQVRVRVLLPIQIPNQSTTTKKSNLGFSVSNLCFYLSWVCKSLFFIVL